MTARTWFITGVNSGFGRQLAEQLLARGDRVAGTVRNLHTVDDLYDRYPGTFWRDTLDVTDTHAIRQTVQRAFAALGQIDVVVNNAGYGQFGPAETLTDAQISRQIETNLIGPIQVSRAVLPYLRAQGSGRILAMSTYGGQATHAGASLYHASKWGMEGFFDSLCAELAPFGIGVTIVEPGGARTGFRSTASVRMGSMDKAYQETPIGPMFARLSDPDYVANGDPAKMVAIIIASIDETPAPLRIVLGSDSYAMIRKALSERLASVETQYERARSTDYPARS